MSKVSSTSSSNRSHSSSKSKNASKSKAVQQKKQAVEAKKAQETKKSAEPKKDEFKASAEASENQKPDKADKADKTQDGQKPFEVKPGELVGFRNSITRSGATAGRVTGNVYGWFGSVSGLNGFVDGNIYI